MSIHDFYYNKLENEEVSTEKLKLILTELDNVQPDFNSKHNLFDLYLKMSENKNADDDLIMQLVGKNLYLTGGLNEETYRILDNGSKVLFDDLWNNGPYEFTEKFWRSKHTDEKQLMDVYLEQFSSPLPSNMTKQSRLYKIFLKHPNVPDNLMFKATQLDSYLITMASNPNIASKKKTFDFICKNIRENGPFDANQTDLLETLTKNKDIPWDIIATGINLEDKLISGLNEDPPSRRVQILLDFCKRRDCPDNIREYIYERTRDTEFLPQVAKDIFLF